MERLEKHKMKTITIFFIAGLLMFLFCYSCQSPRDCEITEDERIVISNEIETIIENLIGPDLNYQTHIDLRADTTGYIFAGDGSIIFSDYQSYKEGVKLSFENIQRFIELKCTRNSVYVLGPAAAVSTIEFEGKYITKNGDTIGHNGCWTFVFKKFDNDWKVIQENGTHTN
jgi:hypothetical protein